MRQAHITFFKLLIIKFPSKNKNLFFNSDLNALDANANNSVS